MFFGRNKQLVIWITCQQTVLHTAASGVQLHARGAICIVAHLVARLVARDLPFKFSVERRSILIKQVLHIAPSNRHTITLLTPRVCSRLSPSTPPSVPPSSSFSLPPSPFILALYPPSLPRAYLDARLKIDPITAIGDILKSRVAELRARGRASERANGRETNGRISASVSERAISAGGASSKRRFRPHRFFRYRSTCFPSSRPPSRLGRYAPEFC